MLKIIHIDFVKESNNKDPKCQVGDHVRISKCKNIFPKGYTVNWSEKKFLIKKVKKAVPRTYVIKDLNSEKIIGSFIVRKELQNRNQKDFRIEKVIKRKEINYMLNGKAMIIHLIDGLIKKTLYKMS